MWLTELNRSVYRTGWPTVENIAEDADDDFFQSWLVSHIMKIMFYIRWYPNETTMVMNTATPWTWAILTSNDAKRNFI